MNRALLKRIWNRFEQFHKYFYVTLFVLLVQQGLGLLYPFLYGKAINCLAEKKSWSSYVNIIVGMFLIRVTQKSLEHARDMYEQKHIDYSLPLHAREGTLKHYLGLPLGFHRAQNSGLSQTVIEQGESGMKSMMQNMLYRFLPTVLGLVLTLAIMIAVKWSLGLIALMGAIAYASIVLLVNGKYAPAKEKLQEMSNRVHRFYSEALRHVSLVKIFGREKETTEEIIREAKEVYAFKRVIKRGQMRRLRSAWIIIFTANSAILYCAGSRVWEGQMSAGEIITFLSWAYVVIEYFQELANLHTEWSEIFPALKKYFSVMDIDEKVRTDAVVKKVTEGDIVFENVSFTYPEKRYLESDKKEKQNKTSRAEVLHAVSFVAKAGETLAIVGKTGSGKSTIINLLIQAYDPDQGRIMIGGQTLSSIEHTSLVERIGFVPQSIHVFDRPLKYNCSFSKANLSDEELLQAADEVGLRDFIESLPEGLRTRVGEGGVQLSGGQRQRLALMMALLRKPKLLLLDEATSSLDTETEETVKATIKRCCKENGATAIIIAHRLSTIRDADKILVLDKGAVAGFGTHEELLEICQAYQKLNKNSLVFG